MITVFAVCVFARPIAAAQIEQDNAAAVIYAYTRIGEPDYSRTNTSVAHFQAHVQELLYGGYTVLPIPDIVDALAAGRDLPPRTVGISFDGGYKSAMTNGAPLLLRARLPFTVFIAANEMDDAPDLASWKTFKTMAKKHKSLVSFGLMPALNTHMGGMDKTTIMTRLNAGRMAIKKHLKRHIKLSAYPFGVYDRMLYEVMRTQGMRGVFGLHSGVMHINSDILALPRFAMSENYSDLSRFILTANALPLPVLDVEPAYSYAVDTDNMGFTLTRGLRGENDATLSCFISGQTAPHINILGGARVEIRPAAPITAARTRVNCTIAEGADDQKRWRWFGLLLVRD